MFFVITIKNQITYVRNYQIFMSVIKLSLIPVGVLSWIEIKFFYQLCYVVHVFMRLCIRTYALCDTCHPIFSHVHGNESIIENLRACS
jgi:hypothetical protein